MILRLKKLLCFFRYDIHFWAISEQLYFTIDMGIASDMHSNFELSIFFLLFTSIQLSIFLFAFDLLIDMLRLHNSLSTSDCSTPKKKLIMFADMCNVNFSLGHLLFDILISLSFLADNENAHARPTSLG